MHKRWLLLVHIGTLGLLLCCTPAQAAAIDEEAQASLLLYHMNHHLLTRCHERFYRRLRQGTRWNLMELQDVSPAVTADELTYDDRLNGVVWRGRGRVNTKAYRVYAPRTGWGAWQQPPAGPAFRLVKQWGQWVIAPQENIQHVLHDIRPVECQQIKALRR